jgi:hypothetical protein
MSRNAPGGMGWSAGASEVLRQRSITGGALMQVDDSREPASLVISVGLAMSAMPQPPDRLLHAENRREWPQAVISTNSLPDRQHRPIQSAQYSQTSLRETRQFESED